MYQKKKLNSLSNSLSKDVSLFHFTFLSQLPSSFSVKNDRFVAEVNV